ncbi:MAG: hypothetical protein QME66_05890 [Candidatus Eisenbacteria bacterium]|nr:hypothetical protein [Candidatus Eisenbacteria bacterium]
MSTRKDLSGWEKLNRINGDEKEALLSCYGMCGGRITDHLHYRDVRFKCLSCGTLRKTSLGFNMYDLGMTNSKIFHLTGTSKSFGKESRKNAGNHARRRS